MIWHDREGESESAFSLREGDIQRGCACQHQSEGERERERARKSMCACMHGRASSRGQERCQEKVREGVGRRICVRESAFKSDKESVRESERAQIHVPKKP
jgi:hypothetical protein